MSQQLFTRIKRAAPGAVIVYTLPEMAQAHQAWRTGEVLLYQREIGWNSNATARRFEHCALKLSPLAARFVEAVSAGKFVHANAPKAARSRVPKVASRPVAGQAGL
jgi:hypothetical protein